MNVSKNYSVYSIFIYSIVQINLPPLNDICIKFLSPTIKIQFRKPYKPLQQVVRLMLVTGTICDELCEREESERGRDFTFRAIPPVVSSLAETQSRCTSHK